MWKWYVFWFLVFIGGVSAVVFWPHSMQEASTAAPIIAPAFDKERAWQDLLYQVNAGFRVPGSETHSKVRAWLVAELSKSSSTVSVQPFTRVLGGKVITMWNIIAQFSGTAPLPRENVLLAAHWDTRPTADQDPDLTKRNKPIPGANDGASGVAVLLEVARQLKAHPVKRDVTIVLFDGEDYGPQINNMFLGATYYATHLKKKPTWGILLDMIGDKNLDIYREPNSDRLAKTVNDRVFRAARALGYVSASGPFIDTPYQYPIEDDHLSVNKAGVPMVDLIDFDYPTWHTLDDTPEQCSATSLRIVGETMLYVLQHE